jgi:hypothetical protein
MVTIRLRDSTFKRVPRRIHLDSEGKTDRPFGNLTPHNNAAPPAVPTRQRNGNSRYCHGFSNGERPPIRTLLFHSNNGPEDAVSRDALQGSPNAGVDGDDIRIEEVSGY